MRLPLLIIAAFASLTAACNNSAPPANEPPTNGSAIKSGSELSDKEQESGPTLELVSTHDIDISARIKVMAFSPNNVASWLGKIALLSDDGALFVSGAEGQSLKSIGRNYQDVIGLRRNNQPAIFIALSDSGALDAYIESDDEGNFTQIPTGSPRPLNLKAFCRGAHSPTDQLLALTQDDRIIAVPIDISAENTDIGFGQPDIIVSATQPNSLNCAYGDGAYYGLSDMASPLTLTLTRYSETGETQSRAVQTNNPSASLSYIADTAQYGGLIAINNAAIASLYGGNNLGLISDIAISDGLSIGGMEASAGLFSTNSSFGGASYNDGIIAFPEAQQARIVFISRNFMLERLAQIDLAKP